MCYATAQEHQPPRYDVCAYQAGCDAGEKCSGKRFQNECICEDVLHASVFMKNYVRYITVGDKLYRTAVHLQILLCYLTVRMIIKASVDTCKRLDPGRDRTHIM